MLLNSAGGEQRSPQLCCTRSTPWAGLFPHAAPHFSPDHVGRPLWKGWLSFQSTLFYEAKKFPFYLSCLPAAMFFYTHCASHVICYRIPRESIPQPKKVLKNTLKVKNDRCHLQGFHERIATKLETGSTEIVESVQCLTKFNFIFKWSPPWHPKIELTVIYRGCHNRIWGHFLPLWSQDRNSFVLGKNIVLKWQSRSQMTSSQEAQFLMSAQGAAPNVEKG